MKTRRSVCMLIVICMSFTAVMGAPGKALGNEENLARLAEGNTGFAIDLYSRLKGDEGNLFFSPYSISTALAMAHAGARGETAEQMAEAMRLSLEQSDLPAAFRALAERLKKAQSEGEIALNIANSLWPQQGYPFLDEYLTLLEEHFGVSVTPVDFRRAIEAAEAINQWVEKETEEKIKNLISPDALDDLTRLVLVNAIYFKGDWEKPFEERLTRSEQFFVTEEKTVEVDMMQQKDHFPYAQNETLQILELPYAGGDVSMLILLPRTRGDIAKVEGLLTGDPGRLAQWTEGLRRREVQVYLPRFKFEWGVRSLVGELRAMGMEDAFAPGRADLSGMDGTRELFIKDVVHKAFVEVNEEGTEAAAATGIIAGVTSVAPPPPVFRADHPFLFLIRENETGSILFMGRVNQPEHPGNDAPVTEREESRPLPVVRDFRGSMANTEIGPSTRVARNQEEWKTIWRLSTSGRIPPPDAPEIDFDRHMVVAVFMGRRNTGGYSVTIESVREVEERVLVRYSTRSPVPGDMVTMAITSPYHIVIVPRIEGKEVVFETDQPASSLRPGPERLRIQ